MPSSGPISNASHCHFALIAGLALDMKEFRRLWLLQLGIEKASATTSPRAKVEEEVAAASARLSVRQSARLSVRGVAR